MKDLILKREDGNYICLDAKKMNEDLEREINRPSFFNITENKMATVSKEVTKTEATPPMIVGHQEFDDFFGDIELTQKDLIVPMIKLMNSGSDLVKDGHAQIGEYRKTTGELMAEKDSDLEVIVFKLDKYYAVNQIEMTGQGWTKVTGTFRREAFTADGDDRWQYEEDDKTFKRELIYTFYVIIADETEQVFNQIPSIINLSSSGKEVARTWLSKLQNIKGGGKDAHSYVFNLGRTKKTKGKNSWLVPTISIGRETSKHEQGCAALWRTEFKGKQIKTEHEETGDEA